MINYLSKPFKWFFKLEAASGLVLLFAAIIALFISNSNLADLYFSTLNKYLFIGINNLRSSLLALIISFVIFIFTLNYLEGVSLGLVCFYIGGATFFISQIIKKILLKDNLIKTIVLLLLLSLYEH